MAIAIIVTHPHYDICGEITHWDRTEINRFDDEDTFVRGFTDDDTELRALYEVVQQYGS